MGILLLAAVARPAYFLPLSSCLPLALNLSGPALGCTLHILSHMYPPHPRTPPSPACPLRALRLLACRREEDYFPSRVNFPPRWPAQPVWSVGSALPSQMNRTCYTRSRPYGRVPHKKRARVRLTTSPSPHAVEYMQDVFTPGPSVMHRQKSIARKPSHQLAERRLSRDRSSQCACDVWDRQHTDMGAHN